MGNFDSMANFGILVVKNEMENEYDNALKLLKTCIENDWNICYYSLSLFIQKMDHEIISKKVIKKI